MKAGIQFDTRALRDVMLLYAKATKKDEVAIVNRTARNFAIKVIMRTPKASPEKIEGELKGLPRDTFLGLVFSKMRKSTKQGRGLLRMFKANTGQGSRQAMALAMRKFIEQRKASGGYIRRGWYKIARTFGGGRAVSADLKGGKGRAVKKSTAQKATEQSPAAVFENMSAASATVAWQATQEALDATVSDMRDYAYRVMQGTAKKYSAKR
jgi:hypothetical protein